jgi:hypothetical protein
VTNPPTTVAAAVLLELQVAVSVIITWPLQVFAVATICEVFWPDTEALRVMVEAGCKVIDWIHPTVTVSAAVPLSVGFSMAVAVMVDVPMLTEVARPLVLIVATLVSELVQVTAGVPGVLPSYVPVAENCWVLPVVPV